MAKKAGLVWVDAQGQRVLNVITSDTGVGPIETSLAAHSNAAIIECWEGPDEVYAATPVVADYTTVRVTVVLYFRSSVSGSRVNLFLPAPDIGIFLSDGTTVDPTAISDVIAAANAHLLCPDGNLADQYMGGQLFQTKFSAIATFTPP